MDTSGVPMEPVMPVPPVDGTADHPDLYIPEPVRHFLPYFHKQMMDKVCHVTVCGFDLCILVSILFCIPIYM